MPTGKFGWQHLYRINCNLNLYLHNIYASYLHIFRNFEIRNRNGYYYFVSMQCYWTAQLKVLHRNKIIISFSIQIGMSHQYTVSIRYNCKRKCQILLSQWGGEGWIETFTHPPKKNVGYNYIHLSVQALWSV